MKKINSIGKILLLCLLAFSFVFSGFLNVDANEDNWLHHQPDTEFSHSEWFIVDDEGLSTQLEEDEINSLKEKAIKQHEQKMEESEVLLKSEFEDEEKVLKNYLEEIKPQSSYFKIDFLWSIDSDNSRIILSATVSEQIGTPPMLALVGFNLYNNNTRYGAFQRAALLEFEWNNPRLGQSRRLVHNVDTTYFWTARTTMTVAWPTGSPQTRQGSYETVLLNSKAKPYPTVENLHNGQTMAEPSSTTWAVDPVERADNLRATFIAWYIDTYGNPRWDWSPLDIHHVRPLKYGGSNNMSNLFPVPRDFHQQVISPWWTNY
ncbi:HNH endonuclease [Bacillus sp. A301a_S52]|jgi:hypothetical protein|nr:HNH endonuclease [Bacillus sp. A301a_S52]